MHKIMLILVVFACFMAVGCGSKTNVSYAPPTQAHQAENTMVYNSNINRVWDAAIKSIGEKFFVLDNIAKDSRIITLSFSVNDPSNYIDCGNVTVETSGMTNSGTWTYAGAQPNAKYFLGDPNTPHPQPVNRTARLEGKANIIFSEEGPNRTRVIVNVRYVMMTKFESQRWTQVGWGGFFTPTSSAHSVSFNTGQEGVASDGPGLRCVTRYTLEKSILEGIRGRL